MKPIVRYHVFVGTEVVQSYVPRSNAVTWIRTYNRLRPKFLARKVRVLLPEPRDTPSRLSYT